MVNSTQLHSIGKLENAIAIIPYCTETVGDTKVDFFSENHLSEYEKSNEIKN